MDRHKTRRQMLHTDRNALLEWVEALEEMAKDGAVCVVAHKEVLLDCPDLIICEI